jgi:Tfp pilus assembly protein PilW
VAGDGPLETGAMTRSSLLRRSPSGGFSVVELVIAVAVLLLVTSAVFAMLDPAGGAFQTQPEAADVLQRLRAASEVLRRDLVLAGSSPSLAGATDPVGQAAVFPMRIGRRNPDAVASFSDTRISFWSVSPFAPQATLATPLPASGGAATIAAGAGCADADSRCGFRAGTTVAAFGSSGTWDLFSVTGVQDTTLTLQHNLRDSARIHPAGSTTIAEVTSRTYFFRDDPASGFARLVRYDNASGADVPVIDHVVRLKFEYFGDAEPPMLVSAAVGGPVRATYGPLPPPTGTALTSYPPGENCVFARTAAGATIPRLPALAATPVLVPLAAADLVDGPWCPDALDPNRYDADLLRVRQVVVSLRVESAVVSLRGPAGPLFTRGGTARGNRLVPDRALRIVIAPRALNAGR